MTKSALVIFKINFPEKKKEWWQQFDIVVAPKQLGETIQKCGIPFLDIDDLIDPGSMQEASGLLAKLSYLTVSDGRLISKLFTYEGYELWWVHYGDLMQKFCLPYTQYQRLLEYLKGFSKICIYKPPFPILFNYYFDSHDCQYSMLNELVKRFIPLGILFQAIVSVPFLLWLKMRTPRLMVWTSDEFDQSHDYDFRMKFIYEEIRNKKIAFVEFIRSMESSPVVLKHALRRRRPVIYSTAIVGLIHFFADFFDKKNKKEITRLLSTSNTDPEQAFWFLVATHYMRNVTGTVWSIKTIKFILKFIGIKAAIINDATSRTIYEVLACKLSDIKVIGIQHGVSSKYNVVSDFMPGFSGEKRLSVDKFGLWSEWWKEYYIKNSKVYKPEQLFVSGHMRPLQNENVSFNISSKKEYPIKVLFVSEQLAAPSEVIPYLQALMNEKNISVSIKFRTYRDSFENRLKENQPEILNKVKIMRGSMHEAIAEFDVIVGSYSTGVLEALLQLKPLIFFHTNKWGDYFELKDFNSKYSFFAENPQELIHCIEKSREIPQEILKELQHRFFGDPYKNGSKWVVDQAEKFFL